MKSRVREFNDTRNKNLTQIYSNRSNAQTYKTSFQNNKDNNNQSFTSSFLKKQKPDVCVSCVNKKIVNYKRDKEIKEKEQTIQQINTLTQRMKNDKYPNQEYRQKLKKQAEEYNKSLIATHLQTAKSQKIFDKKYISQQIKRQQLDLKLEKQRLQEQQAKKIQYKQELFHQYKQEQQNKSKKPIQKLNLQPNSLPIKDINNAKMVIQYQKQLKKQINNNKIHKLTEKQKQIQKDKIVLQLSQKQFEKYTQFSRKQSSNINPQVFQQLDLIDYSKRINKLEQRQRLKQERLQQLQRERLLSKSEIQRSAQLKKQYERELKNQITQKKIKLLTQKQKDLQSQQSFYKYNEQIAKQGKILKPCDECSNKFEEKCLI